MARSLHDHIPYDRHWLPLQGWSSNFILPACCTEIRQDGDNSPHCCEQQEQKNSRTQLVVIHLLQAACNQQKPGDAPPERQQNQHGNGCPRLAGRLPVPIRIAPRTMARDENSNPLAKSIRTCVELKTPGDAMSTKESLNWRKNVAPRANSPDITAMMPPAFLTVADPPFQPTFGPPGSPAAKAGKASDSMIGLGPPGERPKSVR